MHVEMRPIATIRPYENNPRHKAAVEAVAASIRAFGVRQPLVVDEQGNSSARGTSAGEE